MEESTSKRRTETDTANSARGSTVADAVLVSENNISQEKKTSFITCLFYRQSGFYGRENDGRRFLLAQELLYLPVVQQATRIDVAV
jgi:hypothetical protein